VKSGPWGRLDTVAFRAALSASALCSTEQWSESSIHDLAQLYSIQISNILDILIPLRTVSCRRRPFDPWFDDVEMRNWSGYSFNALEAGLLHRHLSADWFLHAI